MWCQNGRSSVIGLQYFCGPIREVLTFGGEAWDSLLFTFLQMGNPLSFSSILCKNQLSWFLIKWFSAYAFHKTKDHLQGIVTLCFYYYYFKYFLDLSCVFDQMDFIRISQNAKSVLWCKTGLNSHLVEEKINSSKINSSNK